MSGQNEVTRRDFVRAATGIAAAAVLDSQAGQAASPAVEKAVIRVGLIGCGSVSGVYLPQLAKSPHAKVVSLCDRIFERAEQRGTEHNVADRYRDIDSMLNGVEFDLLVNTTDMQSTKPSIGRQLLQASTSGAKSQSPILWKPDRTLLQKPDERVCVSGEHQLWC